MRARSQISIKLLINKAAYYFLVLKKAFRAQAVYRSQVFSKILYSILLYLIQIHIWKSINASNDVEVTNIEYMSGYVLISSLIAVFIAFDMNYIPIIEAKVKNGNVSEDLTKPVGFLMFHFFEYLGRCLFKLIFNVVPLIVIFIISSDSTKIDLSYLMYYFLSIIGAMVMFFMINAICGILSFWFVTVGNLHIIIDSSITLFSGSIIPLWMVPDKLKFLFDILPFKYLFYYPISILLGLLNVSEIIKVYLYQFSWCVVLILIASIIYKLGIKRLQVFG